MNTIKYIAIIFLAFSFFGCSHSHEEEEDQNQMELTEKEEKMNEVHLLQKQMDVMDIQLGTFQFINLSTTVKSNGQLELPPQNQASLSALMGGRVKSIFVLEGDFVNKGQILAQLEHPDFAELQEQYLSTKIRLVFLVSDYQMKKSLYSDSFNSARYFEASEAEYQSALARFNSLKSKLSLLNVDLDQLDKGIFSDVMSVKSPIKGYVLDIEIKIGMFVKQEQEMFEIVDNEQIHVDLMVYEKDIDQVKVGQKVIFSLAYKPEMIYEGKIFAVGKSFEQQPKAMVVHAEVENKTGILLRGMYVDARIITNENKVMALPEDALVSDGGLDYIFVLVEEEHIHEPDEDHNHEGSDDHHEDETKNKEEFVFIKVEVSTGATDIGFTEVVPVDPISSNARIVIKGSYYLMAEIKKGEGGEGHHH